jgi:MFS transporter, DHA2 family, multidrug resistance protein
MAEVGARKWIITVTVVLCSVIELIDAAIVNVSLPQMMGNLGATLDEVAWVVTAYVVANVIIVPMASWLAAYFGRRNYYIGSIVVFTVASFFCGHATNIWELVFFRFVQGIGGGALLSTSQSILVETWPPHELGFATSLFGMGIVVGPTVGPTLGGWITDNYTWPWIFYVNLPIGALAIFLALTFIRDAHEPREVGDTDWLGIVLLVAGIGAMQIVLERGERDDWFDATYICVLTAVAAVSIVAFIVHELTTEHPVVDLRVLRYRSLSVGTLFTFIMGAGLYSSVFVFPVFAQDLLGFSAEQTGLLLLPSSLTTALMMPLVGRALLRGAPPRLMIASGFIGFFVFTVQLSHSSLASGQADFFWPLIWRGFGMGLLYVPLTTLSLSDLRGKDIHQGTGFTNMMRQLGGSFGVAIMATYVEHRSWFHRQNLLTHVTPYDPALRERLAALTAGFVQKGYSSVEALQRAYQAVEFTVSRQTMLLTYMEAFRVVGIFFLCCLPLLLLFKARARPVGVASVH